MMCFSRGKHSNSDFGGMRRGLTLPFCCVVRGSDAKVACGEDGKKCNISYETEREHCGKRVAFFRHHFLTVSPDMLAVTRGLSSKNGRRSMKEREKQHKNNRKTTRKIVAKSVFPLPPLNKDESYTLSLYSSSSLLLGPTGIEKLKKKKNLETPQCPDEMSS